MMMTMKTPKATSSDCRTANWTRKKRMKMTPTIRWMMTRSNSTSSPMVEVEAAVVAAEPTLIRMPSRRPTG